MKAIANLYSGVRSPERLRRPSATGRASFAGDVQDAAGLPAEFADAVLQVLLLAGSELPAGALVIGCLSPGCAAAPGSAPGISAGHGNDGRARPGRHGEVGDQRFASSRLPGACRMAVSSRLMSASSRMRLAAGAGQFSGLQCGDR
jgi:hypothetical protein